MPKSAKSKEQRCKFAILVMNNEYPNDRTSIINFYECILPTISWKGKSDIQQKCATLSTPFSGTVFYALSHGCALWKSMD